MAKRPTLASARLHQVSPLTVEICPRLTKPAIRTAVAAIYYEGADENSVPTSVSAIDPQRLLPCSGEPLEQLIPSQVIPANPQGDLTTIEMNMNFSQVRDSIGAITNQWTINDMAYHADLSRSLLSSAQSGTLNTANDFL